MECLILLIPLVLLWAAVKLAKVAARQEGEEARRKARHRHYDNVSGVYGRDRKDFR